MTIFDDLVTALDETNDIPVDNEMNIVRRLEALYARLEPKYTREQINAALMFANVAVKLEK
jgi:hypothetical protein